MNGISMDSPTALLMNMNVDALGFGQAPMIPGQDSAVPGQTDLLGFVNMLDVSQGPSSPLGENVDQLVGELVHDNFETKKLSDASKPSSDDLLTEMSQQANATLGSDLSAIKTNSKMIVGQQINMDAILSNKSQPVSGETMLLGDLKSSKTDAKMALPVQVSKVNPEKIEVQDVAAWSQAFAQNDIESIDLIPEKDNFAKSSTQKMAKLENVGSEEMLSLSTPLLSAAVKEKAPASNANSVLSAAKGEVMDMPLQNQGFQRIVPAKAEATLNLVSQTSVSEKPKADKNEKQDAPVDAADLLLGRQILMDSSSTKGQIATTVKSSSTIGSPADTRLSADSVKLLADKIDTMKENGSATLRVVVNPNEMGKIEIRVQKINGEIRVHLSSDSKEVVRALEDSHAELASRLSGRSQITSVEVGGEIQKSMSEAVRGLSLRSSMPSADVIKLGQAQDSKLNVASSDFGSDFSSFRNPERQEQQGREDSRDRGMKKWQGVFEDRESA